MAARIQRKRTKGWRMPEGAVYVGRPTYWGNPCQIERERGTTLLKRGRWVKAWRIVGGPHCLTEAEARAYAVERYRAYLERTCVGADAEKLLAGHDLACWCPLDQPCHADVLLEIANASGDR